MQSHILATRMAALVSGLTPHITGSKKQSDEGAVLFVVRVHVIVRLFEFTRKIIYEQSEYFSP